MIAAPMNERFLRPTVPRRKVAVVMPAYNAAKTLARTFGDILLTAIENATFLIYLTEYHSGFRAYSRRYLEAVNLEENSDGFVFDTEIIAQGMARGLTIREIPIETRYFNEASQIAFGPSVRYGLAILKTMLLYKLHAWGLYSSRIFRSREN